MNSRRGEAVTRWTFAFAGLAAIVLTFRSALHVNPTTVALTFLLLILLIAAHWSLQIALAISIVATGCYNYYFLPPYGTFTIADPQNWLALFAFLVTSVVGSRLSQKARDEAIQATRRQHEVEMLFLLSRDLLQQDSASILGDALPSIVRNTTHAHSVVLYLLQGDRLYQVGLRKVTGLELPAYRTLALGLNRPENGPHEEIRIPLHTGMRSRGLLLLEGVSLSYDTYQTIGGLVSIALDRAQALEEIAKNEANKESERLRTLILDSIAHDLRTPLTAIKGAAGTLRSNLPIAETDRGDLLAIVEEEADRLNHLVGQAIEMAQLESKEVRMTFDPVSIEDLLQQAQSHCAWVAGTHKIMVQLPALPHVLADRKMITKVLCNLLENAAKYSPSGSPIYITAEEKNGYIITSVADRGVGIDADEQHFIFDRLYRSRNQNGRVSGSGMGLAISRAIVDSHRGKLSVTSQPAYGSVFTFSLPLARDHSA